MIRTLCTLTPGTKADGTRCLKGKLSRAIVTSDSAGVERRYPAGTPLVLSKGRDGQTYSLLAILPDDVAAPARSRVRNGGTIQTATSAPASSTGRTAAPGVDPVQQARARRHEQQTLPIGYSPF